MAEIYNAGTVAVVQGSKTLVLTGGVWSPFNVRKGDIISLPNGYTSLVESVTDTTHLEMALPFDGATASGLAYAIVHGSVEWGTNVEIHHAVVRLLDSVENPLDILFGATVPDNGAGENKQLYIRDNPGGAGHGDIYKKVDDVWQISGNMLGPKGDKGDDGEKGDPGDLAPGFVSLATAEMMRLLANGDLVIGGSTAFGKFNISDGASHTLTLDSTNSYIEIQSYNDPLYINRQGNDVIANSAGGSFGIGATPLSQFHVKGTGEVARIEGPAAGNPYQAWYEDTTRVAYVQAGTGGMNIGADVSHLNLVVGGQIRQRITTAGQALVGDLSNYSSQNGTAGQLQIGQQNAVDTAVIINANTGQDGILSFRNAGQGFAEIVYDRDVNALSFVMDGAKIFQCNSGHELALVGSTTETKALEIGKGRAGDGYAVLDLVGDATYTDFGMRVVRKPGVNADCAIEHRGTGNLLLSANDAGGIVFGTNGAGRGEFDNIGQFKLGSFSGIGASKGAIFGDGGASLQTSGNTDSNFSHHLFYNTFGLVGNILTNGPTTIYNTSSDYRLKVTFGQITDATALDKIMALPVYDGAMKENPLAMVPDNAIQEGTEQLLVLAHEVADVFPWLVTGEKDAEDDDGDPVWQQLDYMKLTVPLIAAIQELKRKQDDLEARLSALESKPEAG